MSNNLATFDAANEAMAQDLVNRIALVISLAEASSDFAPEHNQIITDGRDALAEVAAFFEVDLPADANAGPAL